MRGETSYYLAEAVRAHGTPDYYLAVATIIPLLFIAYFFQANTKRGQADTGGGPAKSRRDQLLTAGPKERKLLWVDSIFGATLVLAGFFIGEISCLLALFGENPTSLNAALSVWGVCLIGAAGVIHLLILATEHVTALWGTRPNYKKKEG